MRLRDRLQRRLTADMRRALDIAVSEAERKGLALYLVGGAVRDLLLDAAHVDVDIAVEGDAIAFATAVSSQLEARAVEHPRFGTATVRNDAVQLDFATTRDESYARPGALPVVRLAAIESDLARRDFSINAMALSLTGRYRGRLIDPQGGRRDVAAKTVRVLHDESFQDDATRIYRAARYAGGLGFRLDRHTDALLRRDLHFLDTISGTRLRREIERVSQEARVGDVLRIAGKRGVLQATHPALEATSIARRAAVGLADLSASHRDAVLLCLLLSNARPAAIEQAIGRLSLTGRQATAVSGFVALCAHTGMLGDRSLRSSEAARLLSPRPVESIESFALIAGGVAATAAREFLGSWRHVRSRLTGDDVVSLGVPRGREVGVALDTLRAARIDGETSSREDEEAMVRQLYGTPARKGTIRG